MTLAKIMHPVSWIFVIYFAAGTLIAFLSADLVIGLIRAGLCILWLFLAEYWRSRKAEEERKTHDRS